MAEISVSKEVRKLLSRIDKKLPASPIYEDGTDDITPNSFLSGTVPSSIKQSSSKEATLDYLKNIYQESIAKYLKEPSIRSQTPTISKPNPVDRSATPTLAQTRTRVIEESDTFSKQNTKNLTKSVKRLAETKEKTINSSTPKLVASESQFRYHPEINQRSKWIDKGKGTGSARWETLYSQGKEKRKQLEKKKIESEISERKKEEFSFKPQILQPSEKCDVNMTVERLNNWAKNKEIRLKEKKDGEIDRDLRECTFMPKTTEVLQKNDSFIDIKGVNPYIKRGKRIQNEGILENTVIMNQSLHKDLNKKKYEDLVDALHNELQSLEL
jgi:hypothetical protein